MRVAVQYFSQLKEIAGCSEESVELPEGATIDRLLARIYELHPGMEKWDRHLLLGAGGEFVERDYVIQPNDEVAIMPPVQGG
ncbi:MAG: MoaD/ThiS family protein [Chthoniobacterales bacterium]